MPALALGGNTDEPDQFTESALSLIKSHGPWPPQIEKDPSNLFSKDTSAIRFGAQLFEEAGFSSNNAIACSTCHIPGNQFIDSRKTGTGLGKLTRNTMSLENTVFNRWYGWDGGSDSLWMQTIRPIQSDVEMNGVSRIRETLLNVKDYLHQFETLTNQKIESFNDEELLVLVAKILAAYQETLVSRVTSFDRYRQALLKQDPAGMAEYPENAKKGLKIFVGKGRCSLCHFGPNFTNNEFADIGIPHFTENGVDKGRFGGIENLKRSKFTLLGIYTDDASRKSADKTRFLKRRHDSFGQFRVPSLRSIDKTGPYMHNGSVSSLEGVIDHYSELNMERLHTQGESVLQPLNLSTAEKKQLFAFLQTLSSDK